MNEEDHYKPDEIVDLIRSMEELLKVHREIKRRLPKFQEDLIVTLGMVTHDYFFKPSLPKAVAIEGEIAEDELVERIASDEDFYFYARWILEVLYLDVLDFSSDEIPPGRKLFYKKIEYPVYTEATVAEEVKRLVEQCNIQDPEDRELLQKYCKEDAMVSEFYKNFEILLHKTLKKLALEYYPQISELSAIGLREIDYALYCNMLMMKQNILHIVASVEKTRG